MFVAARYQDGGGVGSGGVRTAELKGRRGRWGRYRKDEFQLVDRFLVERDGPWGKFKPRVT